MQRSTRSTDVSIFLRQKSGLNLFRILYWNIVITSPRNGGIDKSFDDDDWLIFAYLFSRAGIFFSCCNSDILQHNTEIVYNGSNQEDISFREQRSVPWRRLKGVLNNSILLMPWTLQFQSYVYVFYSISCWRTIVYWRPSYSGCKFFAYYCLIRLSICHYRLLGHTICYALTNF